MKNNKLLFLLLAATSLLSPAVLLSQHPATHSHPVQKKVVEADVQPLLAQAMRLREALTFLGSSLSKEDEKRLTALKDSLLHLEQQNWFSTFLIHIVWQQ